MMKCPDSLSRTLRLNPMEASITLRPTCWCWLAEGIFTGVITSTIDDFTFSRIQFKSSATIYTLEQLWSMKNAKKPKVQLNLCSEKDGGWIQSKSVGSIISTGEQQGPVRQKNRSIRSTTGSRHNTAGRDPLHLRRSPRHPFQRQIAVRANICIIVISQCIQVTCLLLRWERHKVGSV